jgi:glycosyltransferase involved in cell wall biosynthesis
MSALSVVHLAQSDSEGGANRAAYRLHKDLQKFGIRSTFHVGRKRGQDPSVVPAHLPGLGEFASNIVAYLNASALKRYPQRLTSAFSPACISYGRLSRRLLAEADVICAHWIAGAFLGFRQLRAISKPIVWRLSDIWPFSGGCHYPGDCSRFELACGNCPQLRSSSENDLSRRGFGSRERAYREMNITIVAPSRWMANLARHSQLFGGLRIEHIPTGVDLKKFRPVDRLAARQQLGLPEAGSIALFGALGATEDPRKGYTHLIRTVENLATADRRDITLVVFGGATEDVPSSMAGFPVRHLGQVNGEAALAMVYSAADVLIAPFLEDNLPNVVLEAIACGTPVAAFAVGGIPDAVDHEVNGYLSPVGNDSELARGVSLLLDRAGDPGLRNSIRSSAESRFDLVQCSRRYARLFGDVANSGGAHRL